MVRAAHIHLQRLHNDIRPQEKGTSWQSKRKKKRKNKTKQNKTKSSKRNPKLHHQSSKNKQLTGKPTKE